jgi:hypothetical protein
MAMRCLGRFGVRHPHLAVFLKSALIFSMFWIICWQRLDPDFGWHLQAGRYFMAHGIPGHDIYTYTARNFRWIDHEWGYDVIVAWLYGLRHGWFVLATVFAGLWTAVLITADRKANSIVLFLAALAITPYAGIRPMVILLKLARRKTRRIMLVIPLLFLVWANLHGGLLIGLLMLVYFAIRDRDHRWLWVLLASVLLSFINPYGPRDYVEIFRTATDGSLHFQITEWYAFVVYAPSRPYLVLWLCGYWILTKDKVWAWIKLRWHRQAGGEPLGNALTGPLMLAFAMSATRNMPLFVGATIEETNQYVKRVKALIPKQLNKWSIGILTLFVAATLWSVVYGIRQTYRPLSSVGGDHYQSKVVDYLKQHGCEGGNLFNSYDYGGYLIWKLPEQKVYIDGRMPSWRDETGQKYMNRYLKIFNDEGYQKAQFATYNIRCAWLEDSGSTKLITRLEKAGWRVAKQANGSTLLMR